MGKFGQMRNTRTLKVLSDSDYLAKCTVAYGERGKFHGTSCSIFSYAHCYQQLFLKYKCILHLCQQVTRMVSALTFSFADILNLPPLSSPLKTVEYSEDFS